MLNKVDRFLRFVLNPGKYLHQAYAHQSSFDHQPFIRVEMVDGDKIYYGDGKTWLGALWNSLHRGTYTGHPRYSELERE